MTDPTTCVPFFRGLLDVAPSTLLSYVGPALLTQDDGEEVVFDADEIWQEKMYDLEHPDDREPEEREDAQLVDLVDTLWAFRVQPPSEFSLAAQRARVRQTQRAQERFRRAEPPSSLAKPPPGVHERHQPEQRHQRGKRARGTSGKSDGDGDSDGEGPADGNSRRPRGIREAIDRIWPERTRRPRA